MSNDCELYADALDHIMRVARSSRTQTRRLRWIAMRAEDALNGTENWKEIDLPKKLNEKDIDLLRSKL